MNKVVVISGAGAGMGYEVAKLLAAKGMSIAGFDMDPEAVTTVKNDLDSIGGVHYMETLDITNRPGILKFRDKVLAEYGHIDTVLSNVGVGFFGPFEETNLEKALKNVEINLFGAAALLQAFIPSMRERRHGKLVVMASMIGRMPFPFESIYVAGKFAVEGLVSSIRYELEPFGIKVAMIEPSQVSSQFAAKSHNRPPENSPYYDRVLRFSKQNSEILKSSLTPFEAAKKIVKIVESSNPKLHNQLSFKDALNLKMMQLLPSRIFDPIFLKHMNIKD